MLNISTDPIISFVYNKQKFELCSNRTVLENREEQIIETRDKPQYLDIQRYLSYLQYPDETKSSTKDLSLPPFNLKSSW